MNKRIVELIFELKLTCLAKEESIREKLKLSPSEYIGLLSISPGDVVNCMQFSRSMGLSKSRGSRVIDKLIENGYLKLAKNDGDQRIINIKLSPKGVNAVKKINSVMRDCENSILSKVPADELRTFTKTLHKISEIISYKHP